MTLLLAKSIPTSLLEYLQCTVQWPALSNILSAVGQRGLLASREGAMAPLVHPSPWLRPCIHTTAVREHLDYCDGSLSDVVCNLCMVDKSNLTNRSLVTDGSVSV